MSEQRWPYAAVVWGATLCSARCGQLAELLYDGVAYCADDAERLLERQQLLATFPDLAAVLPPVFRADQD